MKTWAVLTFFIIVGFIVFIVYWNKKWRNQIIDERETLIRLKVVELTSRAAEMALVVGLLFHFIVHELSGLQAFLAVGTPAVIAEAFANWYFRREVREDA